MCRVMNRVKGRVRVSITQHYTIKPWAVHTAGARLAVFQWKCARLQLAE